MKKIKESIKELLPAVLLAFVTSFMVYIYEPILTYSTNINDFWFDFKLMFSSIVIYGVIFFLILMLVYMILYLIIKIFSKKVTIFYVILILSFIIFAFTYIQGNYLIGNLPTLNGEIIDWTKFKNENTISLIILFVLILSEIILIKKTKLEKTVKINNYIVIAIFVMLLTSFISVLCTPGMFKEKIIAMATNRNINNVSTDKNFFIFVVDSVDSREFSKVVTETQEYNDTFKNFTYYPDTTSAYLYTRDAIPFILSGIWNEEKTEFVDYYNEAFDKSVLFKTLGEKGYEMNFYEYEIYATSRNIEQFANIDIYNDKIDKVNFFKQLTKYVLFKYLPYPLKQYSKIETADFNYCKIDKDGIYFDWSDENTYNIIKNNDLENVNNKYFQIWHIEGGHVPFDYDENVNKILEEGTYEQKLKATLKIIDSFINRLKENNTYDNSVIVVLADHGEGINTLRQNPILYIKGIDEHHEMEISDIPVAYEDLMDAYIQLLEGYKSTELFQNIDKNRVRRVLNNQYTENRMIEYEQRGKAWDNDAFIATGREFKR